MTCDRCPHRHEQDAIIWCDCEGYCPYADEPWEEEDELPE